MEGFGITIRPGVNRAGLDKLKRLIERLKPATEVSGDDVLRDIKQSDIARLQFLARQTYSRLTGDPISSPTTQSWKVEIETGRDGEATLSLYTDYRIAPSKYTAGDPRAEEFSRAQYHERPGPDPDFNSFIKSGPKRHRPYWDELQRVVSEEFSRIVSNIRLERIREDLK